MRAVDVRHPAPENLRDRAGASARSGRAGSAGAERPADGGEKLERIESARLTERLSLAREIHDSVMPRLTAVAVALEAEAAGGAEGRRHGATLREALADLRSALARPPAGPPGPAPVPMGELLAGLERAGNAHVHVHADQGWERRLPEESRQLVEHFLSEALRNAEKHGGGAPVEVDIEQKPALVTIEVSNARTGPEAAGPEAGGLGLRLVAMHALQRGAVVGFGPKDDRYWHVRLMVPVTR